MSAVSVRRPWWRRLATFSRLAASQSRRPPRAGADALEPRRLMAGDVIISEFMAINGTTIADEDGEFSDWIELHNTTLLPVNLAGWHLTDNANNLDKWTFPDVTIEPQGYLLVFASNKDRATPGLPLHTDFQLDGDGEYLGLIRPDALTKEYEFAPEFPPQESDVSFGTGPARSTVTSLVPTPAQVRVTVPDATTGAGWMQSDYDDSAWATGPTGVGFEVGGGAAAPLPAELEPNDSIAGADDASTNFVPGGAALFQLQVRGNLALAGDGDFFSLGRLEPGDVLTLTQTASNSSRGTLGDSFLELYSAGAGGAPIRDSDDDGTGLDSLIHRHTVTVADTYFVRAGAFSNGGAGTYEMSAWLENGGGTPAPATHGPVPVESEPNDTLSGADDVSSAWRAVQYRSST